MNQPASNIIQFPKAGIPRPRRKKSKRNNWWRQIATWALQQAATHPQIDAALDNWSLAFLQSMSEWSRRPSDKQEFWLLHIMELVERNLVEIARRKVTEPAPGAA